jgi:hypothetical protein
LRWRFQQVYISNQFAEGDDVDAPDDEREPSPQEMLRLIQDQRATTARRLGFDPLLQYLPWGLAWLAGFGAVFLGTGPGGRHLPQGVALAVLFLALGAATVVFAVAGVRCGNQIRGVSQETGAMYGMAWSVAYLTVGAVAGRFGEGLPSDEQSLLWGALSIGVAGLLLMSGAAIWRNRPMFAVGCWVSVVNVAGVFAGPGWHPLVASLAGGGGMVAAGVLLRWRMSREQAA